MLISGNAATQRPAMLEVKAKEIHCAGAHAIYHRELRLKRL